jgi:hypothetical protein
MFPRSRYIEWELTGIDLVGAGAHQVHICYSNIVNVANPLLARTNECKLQLHALLFGYLYANVRLIFTCILGVIN